MRTRSLAVAWVRGMAAVALAASVTGCVATETPVAPRGIAVSSPPPPPPPEPQRPPAPSAASVWIAGYWHWTGMQYAWIPGHWENGPPGAAWAAPRYTASEGETIYEPGRWKPATNTTANALH